MPRRVSTGIKQSIKKLRRRLKKQPMLVPAALLALGGVTALALVIWVSPVTPKPVALGKISDVCAKNQTVTYGCYKDELTKIVKEQGPDQAFALLKQQYTAVPYVKSQCHQLTHVVGRSSLDKYGNLSDTYAHGDQFCWSGFYHGVMEQLINEKGYDYTVKNADSICAPMAAKSRYSFYHYNCVHGLGHGFMFALKQEMFDSLTACESLSDSWERTSCYGGVFMQNIMDVQSPDEEAGHTSKFLKVDDPMYPCNAIDTKYKGQCYLMQTSYALQVENYDFAKVFSLCSQIEPDFKNTCFQSLGRDASGQSISNAAKTKASCMLGADYNAQVNCIVGAAKDFVAYFHSDAQAKGLCDILNAELQPVCYSTVKSYYSTF